MTTKRNDFRLISLEEYRTRESDTERRITMDEMETGLLVEVYSTSMQLELRETAINFTAQIEVTDSITRAALGQLGIKLLVYSGEILKPLYEHRWDALVYPSGYAANSHDLPRTPLATWALAQQLPVYFPKIGALRYGFFSKWAEDDTSTLDTFDAPHDSAS